MKPGSATLVAVLSALLFLAPVGYADEAAGPVGRLVETRSAAIVSVKFTLKITMDRGGQQREQERNARSLGVVVDPQGLVMLPSSAFEVVARRGPRGRRGRGGRGQGENTANVSAKASNIRIVFPGDDKEHPAILGAKDSKYGLAFLLVSESTEGKNPVAVDWTRVATPEVGQSLYGVARLGQSFDHAPICGRVFVMGKVSKPHAMWAISDGAQFLGMPLYTLDGAVAGVCALQRGVGQGTARRPFLLPIDTVRRITASAKTAAEKALKEMREAESAEEDDG